MMQSEENGKWPKGWQPVESGMARRLEDELRREVHTAHKLYEKNWSALAGRLDRDDVLFFVHGNQRMFAEVHLTWSNESNSEFPWTICYDRLEDWRRSVEDETEGS